MSHAYFRAAFTYVHFFTRLTFLSFIDAFS